MRLIIDVKSAYIFHKHTHPRSMPKKLVSKFSLLSAERGKSYKLIMAASPSSQK